MMASEILADAADAEMVEGHRLGRGPVHRQRAIHDELELRRARGHVRARELDDGPGLDGQRRPRLDRDIALDDERPIRGHPNLVSDVAAGDHRRRGGDAGARGQCDEHQCDDAWDDG
jgi:hypothetical protein